MTQFPQKTAVVEAQLAELQQQFPALTKEQLEQIRQRLASNFDLGRQLQAMEIGMAVEPAGLFDPRPAAKLRDSERN